MKLLSNVLYSLVIVLGSGLFMPDVARAGVLQAVVVKLAVDGVFGTPVREEVFGATSSDITDGILAQIGAFPTLGFRAVSSASQFGSVGLSGAVFPRGIGVQSSVFVASDEFTNVTGAPQRATANFVIDGGSLFIEAGRDVQASYFLHLTAWNLGNVPIRTERSRFPPLVRPSLIATGEFITSGVLEADASGNLSFTPNQFLPGRDIGAVFDPLGGRVEIPLSLQSLELGILAPGDRLFLDYELELTADVQGRSEGAFVRFSDPFNLSGSPALPTIVLQPLELPSNTVPEPSTFALIVASALVPLGLGLRRRIRADMRPRTSNERRHHD